MRHELTADSSGIRRSPASFAANPRGVLALTVLLAASAATAPNALAATLAVCKKGCAYQTIQSAINASKSGDTITIGAGTFLENLVIEAKTLAIYGGGEDVTVIDGGFLQSTVRLGPALGAPVDSRDFAHVTLSAVAVTHGSNSGILVNGGSLNLQGSALVSNQATAVYPISSQFGGGINVNSASVTVGSSILTHNKSSVGGGAIAAGSESHIVVTNSTISRNTSADGGGFYIDITSSVSITGSTLSDNTANGVYTTNGLNDGGTGGAIYVSGRDVIDHLPGGTLTVDTSSLVDNTSASDGDGVEGYVSMSNSVVARNKSGGLGGGITGGAMLSNVFVVENSAAVEGGGVYAYPLQETGSTIADNTPDNCTSLLGVCPAP